MIGNECVRYSKALKGLAALALLAAAALPALGSAAATLAFTDVQGAERVTCPQAHGVYLAMLVPRKGLALLATKPFPGGQEVGVVEDDRIRFALPGMTVQELPVTSSQPGSLPIWGMADRTLAVGNRSGCFSFGDRDFTSEDDLKTYLHWISRDVFFRLRAADDAEPLGFRLADRSITLQISTPGHRPIQLKTREAGTAGIRLPDSESVYYFQPLILDEAAGRLAVKVLVKEGPFFGEGTAKEIAFVIVAPESPGVTPTDPVLEIRSAGID